MDTRNIFVLLLVMLCCIVVYFPDCESHPNLFFIFLNLYFTSPKWTGKSAFSPAVYVYHRLSQNKEKVFWQNNI